MLGSDVPLIFSLFEITQWSKLSCRLTKIGLIFAFMHLKVLCPGFKNQLQVDLKIFVNSAIFTLEFKKIK